MGPVCRYAWLCAVFFALSASAEAQDFWQGQNIYQIVTDRFFNGDVSNDNADGNYNASAGQAVHGGDFKGIEQKLDYIKALGATAIWISPVVLNGNGDYHGYAGRDFFNVDPHWGSLNDLKHFIDAAHAKGLLVIDDIVVNHGAQLLNSNDSGYPNFRSSPGYNVFYRDNSKQYAAPFHPGSGQALNALFHDNGFIQDFNNVTQVENGSLLGLDDFRTESSFVRTNMADIYKFWIDQGFDGFRIDTVKHVEAGFWQTWCPQIHQHASDIGKPDFFMFGEVYDRSETKNASYTGTKSGGNFELDSVLDYPLYFSINPVFALATANTKRIEDHYHAVDANYDVSAQQRLVTFLDNHDQPRFLNSANANNNFGRASLGLTFLYTSRGIPCLYYGTEQGFNGGADPGNREDMFAGQFEQGPSAGDNFNQAHALFQLVAKLNNLRRLYPALRNGSHVNLWNNPTGPGLFAYSRRLNDQEVVVVLNTAGITQTLPNRPTIYVPGMVLVNLLDPNETIVIASGGETPSLSVPATTAKLFIAQAQVLPLDPVVTGITPGHDVKNVSTPSKVVIRFSKPMDTASVQTGFSTFPPTTGTFTWSQGNDELTYQASGGLPELSTVFVRIAQSAADSTGKHLYAGFESRFVTAVHTVQDTTPPTISIFAPPDGATEGAFFQVNGLGSDETSLDRIEVKLDEDDWRSQGLSPPPNQQGGWTKSYTPSLYLNGWHTVTARAVDSAGNISSSVSIRVKFAAVPDSYYLQSVHPSQYSTTFTDCSGTYWFQEAPYNPTMERSYGYVGGNMAISSNPIAGACQQEQKLYQAERYSSPGDGFKYVFNCPTGIYKVTLLDAETFMSGPNQRRFDVYIQGDKVLPNFDIFLAAGGANRAISYTFNTTVSNALLTVDFRPVYDNARLSAISVRKIGDVFTDSDGIADWWRLAHFGHATGFAEDQSRTADDPDHDGMTNLEEFRANTDPTNLTSAFRVLGIQKDSNGSIAVIFYASRSRTYQLQRASNLQTPDWQNVGDPWITPGYQPEGAFSLFDSTGGSLPSPQFYRVIIIP